VANHARVVAQEFMQEKFLVVGCSQSNIDVVEEPRAMPQRVRASLCCLQTTSNTRDLYITVRTTKSNSWPPRCLELPHGCTGLCFLINDFIQILRCRRSYWYKKAPVQHFSLSQQSFLFNESVTSLGPTSSGQAS